MQEHLDKALEFANYRQTFAIQRKTLKEKIDAQLTYGVNGGIFKIDRSLLNFVEMLIFKSRRENVVLLDKNDNPILIEDLTKFRDEIFDRYFSATFAYLEEYQKIKKARSVETILEV
jgi:hypothetical protein|tara:strand:+ start:134 stop:484 length:351 start_codon:yes stop_codon:yes gene_type:complete